MTTWQMDEIDRLNKLRRDRRWWRRLLRVLTGKPREVQG